MSEIFLKKLFNIYTNVLIMLHDRGYSVSERITDPDDFIKEYERKLIFVHDDTKSIVVYISKENPPTLKKRTFIKKNYESVMKNTVFHKSLRTMIIVTNVKVISRMLSYIIEDPTVFGKYDMSYIYSGIFEMPIPQHDYTTPHILLSQEEKESLYSNSTYHPGSLDKIHETDPMSIWYGARQGDVFKIIRRNNTRAMGKKVRNDYLCNVEEIAFREVIVNPKMRLYV